METAAVCDEVRGFLEPYIEATDFSNDDDIFSMGLVNSLMAMQLVLFLEKRYGFKFEGDDLDLTNFRTLTRIHNLVTRKLGKS